MIYLKTFQLLAPFDNDVVQTLSFHWGYWKKYGFSHTSSPLNPLCDSIGTYSSTFGVRNTSARLGPYTLSDFLDSTRPGDIFATYIFSVISTEKDIVDETIIRMLLLFIPYVNIKTEEHSDYQLTEVKETIFAFDGVQTEKLSKADKLKKWEDLINDFPYVDKVYKWLLVNRNYPEVK